MPALTTDIIRLLLQKGQPPQDAVANGTPTFNVGTDIQFNLADAINGVLTDDSQFSSVTLAIKNTSDEDSSAIISATVTPANSGWNGNPCQTPGSNIIPGYAQYSNVGAGASATATVAAGAVTGTTSLVGGSGYATPPLILVTPTSGDIPTTLAVLTAVLTNGVVTGIAVTTPGAGYTHVPTLTFIALQTYVFGVQTGASYTWTIGENDFSLLNGSTPVVGSNLVNTANVGSTGYNATGAATLSGLTANGFYYFLIGANDTHVAGFTATAPPYFTSTGTTAALLGTANAQITSQVYPATAGNNLIPGSSVYPAGTPKNTGSQLVPGVLGTGGTAAYNGTSGTGYYTLTGLTPGATYSYTLGANEQLPAIGSASGSTTQTGYFTALSTTVTLAGQAGTSVTTAVYLTTTTGVTSSFTLTGLTIGQTYFFTLNSDVSVNGSNNTTGFFTANSSSVTLVGQAGGSVTATIQQVKPATSGTFIASGNTVTLIGTAASSVTAQLTGNVGWASGTDQLCVIPFSNSQTTLSTPDGGSTTYWLLVTAVTTGGKKLVLGSGNIIATDSGQGKGVLTNNLVPGSAAYSASTGSAASVTATVSNGAVTGFTGLSGGSLYSATNPPAVVFTGGGGMGAAATCTVVGGIVTAVNLTAGGSGYTTAPTVSFATSSYTLNGLTPGFVYYWKMNANDTGCGPLTATGSFMATTSSVVLTGTASTSVTAIVYATNQYPYYTTVAIPNGAESFSVSGLALPFTPLGAEATVMLPNATAIPLDAKPDYSSLSAGGVNFYLQTQAPSSGYVALVKIY